MLLLSPRGSLVVVGCMGLWAFGQLLVPLTAVAQGSSPPRPIVARCIAHDTCPPLRNMRSRTSVHRGKVREIPLHPLPRRRRPGVSLRPGRSSAAVVQKSAPAPAIGEPLQSFEGVSNVNGVLPPDPNGDVGPNHYVQWVNLSLAIWDKNGNLLFGPVDGNTIWAGFGGPCDTCNDGDPIVLYDHLADRWLLSQFAFPNSSGGPYYQYIAVSQTSDPTGSWHRYAFLISNTKMNDYPKFGVWPDAYYMAVNQFDPNWAGQGVVAFERDKMLAGLPAQMVYFDLFSVNPDFGGMLPSDLDGPPPPAGTPNYFIEVDDDAWGWPTDRLQIFEFHVDWATPANSTFTGPTVVDTAPFDSDMCGYARACIPQPDTSVKVDALSDRLMYRLQYRNFGTHETLVTNHTVDVGGDHAGIRWYELRKTAGPWSIHQQGTYAPDSEHRWMGSVAMDGDGNIALGFSVSSSTTYPSIRYTGRMAGDPLGTMPQGEGELMAGGGSQTHSASRWGDYSSMSVDPTDDLTFWYTQEYYAATSSSGWRTRIGSFQLIPDDDMMVVPVDGFTSTGPQGGPFAPLCKTYTLTNIGVSPLDWTAAGTESWLDVSPGAGTVGPGDAAQVDVCINSNADVLAESIYTDTVTFTNTTSGFVRTRPVMLLVGQPDYFTEIFEAADNDLANKMVTFTPDGSPRFYRACTRNIAALPTDPAGGTVLPLDDDDFAAVTLAGGATVALYGSNFETFFVGSNGYVTFGSGDTDFSESLADHFALRRISGLFDDLNPAGGGTISWQQFADRAVVTWQSVPEFPTTGSNTFQVEMYFDGRIRLAWLSLDALGGLAGLSGGAGLPPDFQESDLTTYPGCVEFCDDGVDNDGDDLIDCADPDCPGCDDGDPCTDDSCDPFTGQCQFAAKDCDDADPCTDDSCVDGQCINTPVDCNDGDPCTTDGCDPQTGQCTHGPACDDNDPCTDDSCDPGSGDCQNVPKDCDDNDDCTLDSCDSQTGQCVHDPDPCCVFHPSDLAPYAPCGDAVAADWRIELCEMIGYAAAWKSGAHDNLAAMVRAAFLWKAGEWYHWDCDGQQWYPGRELCTNGKDDDADGLVDCDDGTCADYHPSCGPLGPAAKALADERGARRTAEDRPGGSLTVSVTVTTPPGTLAVGLEEAVPSGWLVAQISDDGQWDARNRKIKWGPWLDHLSRTVSYVVTGAGDSAASPQFQGTVCFDGVSRPVEADASAKLDSPVETPGGGTGPEAASPSRRDSILPNLCGFGIAQACVVGLLMLGLVTLRLRRFHRRTRSDRD